MKLVFSAIFFFLSGSSLYSQSTLSLDEFKNLIFRYHPIVKSAALEVKIANSNVTAARGAFDPLLQSDIQRKEFDGLLYYNLQTTELKVPAWFGIDVVAGIATLSGSRTEPAYTKGNTSYFGFSVPLGKGLLIDKRRAALQTAIIFQSLSVQEQRNMLNNLFYESAKAYWNWWQQYQVQLLFSSAIANATERCRLIKTAWQLGDRPAIDTVEALAQLQSFQLRQSEALMAVTNAELEMAAYLWQPNGSAYTLPLSVVPASVSAKPEVTDLDAVLQQAALHPLLQQYHYKLNVLSLEKRLKFQSLLPSVYLKYNQLAKTQNVFKNFSAPWFDHNYKYGLSISVPLWLREGRGEYQKIKLKIEQTEWERSNKLQLQQTKVHQYYNEWQQLEKQMDIQQGAIASYAALHRGEEIKFQNGEGSLFLINARELKLLEAREKEIELQSKMKKAYAAIYWSAGNLTNLKP